MEEKKCNKCGEVLPLSEFSANKKSNDGYSHICKRCLFESKSKASHKRYYGSNIIVDPDSPLSKYTPRQLMEELRFRGYDGEITYVQKIRLSAI